MKKVLFLFLAAFALALAAYAVAQATFRTLSEPAEFFRVETGLASETFMMGKMQDGDVTCYFFAQGSRFSMTPVGSPSCIKN